MNIQEAKEQVKEAVQAYLRKDDYGEYKIPRLYQRPILLLGAPGIGKTQIMAQICRELSIGLVAYTITHHTRQSAIGLPFIREKKYGDMVTSVTEYTMSEIVAAMYEKMEKTGLAEGILFIDEINCVSETLAPAMLQFLQYKTFGSHEIPPGWVIVAAGNPPEYNKSVRDFDVVTLDRVRKLNVEPDYACWKGYAYEQEIHPAILSYLNLKPQHFYKMENTVDGMFFATPRGWEDLSRILKVYQEMGLSTGKEVVGQYIQHPAIAGDFAAYLELFEKYEAGYQLEKVFAGEIPDVLITKVAHAGFDERLSLLGLILSRVGGRIRSYLGWEEVLSLLHPALLRARDNLKNLSKEEAFAYGEELLSSFAEERKRLVLAEQLTPAGKVTRLRAEDFLSSVLSKARAWEGEVTGEVFFSLLREGFGGLKASYDEAFEEAGVTLERAFDFLEAAFGAGQELVIFITELNADRKILHFLEEYECERYYQYNRNLLYEDKSRILLRRIEELEA